MKILAIDTSGMAVSAAVAEDGVLLAYYWNRHGKTHAEALTPCIDAVLRGLNLDLGDIGAFSAITGPGSFTGLRIGVSLIKGFAYARNAMTIGISTLDALAFGIDPDNAALTCPVMDARNKNVYQAIYGEFAAISVENTETGATGAAGRGQAGEADAEKPMAAGAVRLAEPAMVSIGDSIRRLQTVTDKNSRIKRMVFNGDAAAAYIDYYKKGLRGVECMLAGGERMFQNASSAALLACEAANAGLMIPPELLAPDYLNAGYAGINAPGQTQR